MSGRGKRGQSKRLKAKAAGKPKVKAAAKPKVKASDNTNTQWKPVNDDEVQIKRPVTMTVREGPPHERPRRTCSKRHRGTDTSAVPAPMPTRSSRT